MQKHHFSEEVLIKPTCEVKYGGIAAEHLYFIGSKWPYNMFCLVGVWLGQKDFSSNFLKKHIFDKLKNVIFCAWNN